MDRAYSNALKIKEKLETELARVNSFLKMYRDFSASEVEKNEPRTSDSLLGSDKESVNHLHNSRLRPPEIADLAEEVIRKAGRPLTRAEIVGRIESAGYELHSEDKPRYVGTILWRQKERFTNIAGQGYVLADMATDSQNIGDLIERALADDKEPEHHEAEEDIFD